MMPFETAIVQASPTNTNTRETQNQNPWLRLIILIFENRVPRIFEIPLTQRSSIPPARCLKAWHEVTYIVKQTASTVRIIVPPDRPYPSLSKAIVWVISHHLIRRIGITIYRKYRCKLMTMNNLFSPLYPIFLFISGSSTQQAVGLAKKVR